MRDDIDDLGDILEQTLTKEDVEKRVRGWTTRLATLFEHVRAWAGQNDWRISDAGTVEMNEEPMLKFDMPPTQQPTLRLDRDASYALFRPKGLWVIGANGRVDLYTSKGTFVIVDLDEHELTPKWTIFRATDRKEGDAFNPEMIANLV